MKPTGRYILAASLGILLLSRSNAAPVLAVGDNAELFITATANVSSDDNIYLRSSKAASDTIWSFMPGLQMVFGQNSATTGQVYFKENFLKYSSHSAQDTSLANVGFISNYTDGKSKLGLSGSYQQLAQNDTTAPGSIVERNLTNLKVEGEVAVSNKTSVGAGLVYDKTDYGPASYTDAANFSIPLDAYFEISPKLQASVGYRYRSTDLSGAGKDSKDHFFNLGARGEFTPKLTGQLRLGYGKRNFTGGTDQTTFVVDSGFNYAYSEKTAIRLGLTNDFGSSAFGLATKNRAFSAGIDNKIDGQWAWNLGLSQRSIEYPAGRSGKTTSTTDDFFEGSAGVSFIYNKQVNFAASYTHRNNGSDLALAEFTNNVFSLGANIRY